MKNVAIFSLAYTPFVGGAELAIKEITDRLPSDFKFICFTKKFDKKWKDRERLGNVSVVRLGLGGTKTKDYYGGPWGKIIYVIRAWRMAEAMHKKEPFSAVWGMMAAYGGMAAMMFKIRHPRIPFLLTLQEGDSEEHILRRVSVFYPLWKLIFKKADYIQAISNFLAEFAERHGARCPVEIVPNGVAVSGIKGVVAKRKKGEKIIITTSRLVYKNGIDTLIRAIAELRDGQMKDVVCNILGTGPDEAKLKKLVKDLYLEGFVNFLGHVPPSEVEKHLKSADVFVRVSRSEGLGNSFLEAMAAGLPVIGTKVGGIPDFLRDPAMVGLTHATGLFARVDNPKDLALKILLLFGNDELKKHIIRNGKALVLKNYTWETIARRMEKIFQKLIK